MQTALDPDSLAGRTLVFHVNRAGWIVADEYGGQCRLMPVVLQKIGHLLRQLVFDLSSEGFAVKNGRGQTNVPK